jgi:SAM-dependent methyltransferase
MKCPICSSPDQQLVFTAKCGRFDGSVLYKNVNIVKCNDCKHFFNQISSKDYKNLAVYYETEYAEVNAHSITGGDLPGSSSEKTLARYNALYDVLKNYITPDSQIMDVGCALGGFLNFLEGKGYPFLRGVDSNWTYVHKSDRNIAYADATFLPCDKGNIDCIVMDQVLEHLINPGKAIKEAYRALTKDGTLCIAVPDIEEYYSTEPIAGFWYLMREHLQHFSIRTLHQLCHRHGFQLVEFRKTKTPMSGKVSLPNLIAVFKKFKKTAGIYFMDPGQVEGLKEFFVSVAKSKVPIYCWGIGREFMFAYENLGMKNCNIQSLVDSNPHKQGMTIGGIKILDPKTLLGIPRGEVIWIYAFAYEDEINQQLKEMGLR